MTPRTLTSCILAAAMLCGIASPAAAQDATKAPPGAAPAHIRVDAEVYRTDGPPLAPVAAASGQAMLTPDGKQVVYLAETGLYAVSTNGGTSRKLADNVRYFRLTPDGRYAIIPGGPFRRVAVTGDPAPRQIATSETAHGSPLVSNKHAAFTAADGTIVIATLLKGTSRRLVMDPPTDKRCHFGAGNPIRFSPDSKLLTIQSGCDQEWLVKTNGKGLQLLPFISGHFSGPFIFGSPKGESGMKAQIVVLDPKTKETWTVEGVDYSPFRVVVPGQLAFIQANGQKLEYVDLKARKVVTLHTGEGNVTGFISTTPDGETALYAVQSAGHCSIHSVAIATQSRQQLARVENTTQCFIHPLSNDAAAAHFWGHPSGEAIVAHVDLKTGVVARMGPPLKAIGTLSTSGGAVLLTARPVVYAAPPANPPSKRTVTDK